MAEEQPTAAVVVIGNEILSGRTQDANLAYIARRLAAIGVRLVEARVVGDDEAQIAAAVNACRAACTYVFTTGGIGPTHDDITARAVARAFAVPLERHSEAMARLERQYAEGELNAARARMADLPKGAILIDNPVSQAPGFQIGNVFVLAGVPAIMQAMFDGLGARIRGGPPLIARTVSCHLAEGTLAPGLAELARRHPEVEIGSYPFFRGGRFGASLVLRGQNDAAVAGAAEAVCALIRELGGEPIALGD